ncbi:MAG: hypothetical protein LH647_18975 [Leptolyngbyaceae cyanobacterium CAN_BIN12]|nr:hypothetical protein [Leptolyngbyaceae cyanobacterium CAN_BIN12]
MPRPGGNPDINKNPQTFSTERDESLTELLQLRVSGSMKESLKRLDGWQELVRQAIAEKLAKINQE